MNDGNAFHIISRALRDFLGPSPYENEVFILLLVPTVLGLFYLLVYRHNNGSEKASSKDLDFFEIVRLQKGLEEFDRDILIEVARIYDLKPIYKILLEPDAFDETLTFLKKDLKKSQKSIRLQQHIQYMNKIRNRIFKV